MTLTGIYVFYATTLTFQSTETVTLISYDQKTVTASGSPLQATVSAGIYKVETNDPIQTETYPTTDAGNISVFECPSVEVPSNKDAPPNPPPSRALDLYSDVTMSTLQSFFVSDAKSSGFPTGRKSEAESVTAVP